LVRVDVVVVQIKEDLLMRVALCLAVAMLAWPAFVLAQDRAPFEWASRLEIEHEIIPDITYLTASNWESKLDLYVPRGRAGKALPVLIFIHGGGWTGDTKDTKEFVILPYLDMGMSVVNINYRLARVASAPAAVEDCRCALRWVIQHAREYGFDVNRIVVSGSSAGGHLALTTGMLPASAGLDRQCPGPDNLKVAAIVNWFGITDVNELLAGPNMKTYAVTWLGSNPDRDAVAKRVSPMTYVRPGLPPVLTIHGDADPTVPYTQAVRLHKALTDAGVPNELLTVPGGKHGPNCCNLEQRTMAYNRIRAFLTKYHVLDAESPSNPHQER
jgi:acetyl esterase/lipase